MPTGQPDTIKPIKDEASHRQALGEIDRLWGAAAGTADGDRLDILMTLVDAYERERWPDKEIDPVAAIKLRMQNSGRRRKDFEKLVGTPERASDILQRRRRLTLPIVWKLVRQWGIPAALLIQPYKLANPKARGRKARRAA
jgi:HTH-type transcriptional regulator / antitoxin HigA